MDKSLVHFSDNTPVRSTHIGNANSGPENDVGGNSAMPHGLLG